LTPLTAFPISPLAGLRTAKACAHEVRLVAAFEFYEPRMAKRKSHLRALSAAACCLALSLLGGCRNLDNAQVDVLESELRQQEDYIYELEDYLIEYSEKLRQARLAQCPPGTPKGARSGSTTRAPLPEPTIDEDIERPTLPLNGRDKLTAPMFDAPPASIEAPPAAPSTPPAAPATEEINPEELEAPALQIGPVGSVSPKPESLAAVAAPSAEEADGPLLIPDPIDYQADADAAHATAPLAAEAVNEPALAPPQLDAPRLTAQQLKVRHIFRESSEDDQSLGSLLIVVEGVNATDEPADVVGAASLMVMARDENGGLRRVDRWDFTAEETAAAWQSSHLGDGLHLELPLTDAELPTGELELWARVVDDGGAKLLTSAENPFGFDADKLIAMADAPGNTALASNGDAELQPALVEGEETAPTASGAEKSDAATETAAAETPKPQWRASSVRLEKDRVEGFATTAGNKPASWTTTPIGGGQTRVASGPAKTTSPTWKRSARAAVVTESKPEWSAER
jgi:hypothetical protein